jgi:hypothetical protein
MNRTIISIFIILLITSCSNDNEDIVRDYLKECNDFNYEKASSFLDPSYTEVFIDGYIEIKDLNQLKEFIEWREVLESKTDILSIESSGDTIITTEETSHLMDKILERKPRTFKITYILKEEKILKSIIDTLSGFTEVSNFNDEKFSLFENYCSQQELSFPLGMNRDKAILLKKSLIMYKKSH